jgi:hypothetical protein
MKSEISIALLKKDISYMKKGIDDIKGSLNCMVKNDDDYKEMENKVDTLWDIKNKLIGYMLGAGISGGVIGSLLKGIATDVIAMLK